MSVGFSVGDILAVGTLAWQVYKSCKNAPNSFKNISDEVLSLHAVLKESEEVLEVQSLSSGQQRRLETVLKGCNGVLVDLQCAVDRYESLGTKSKRTWDRLGWVQQPIVEMRARLTANILLLSAFVNTSQILVEKRLKSALGDFQDGGREGSVISAQSVEPLYAEDQEETWHKIREELKEAGITVAAFELNKDFIFDWLKKNLVNHALDGTTRPDDQSRPSIDDLSRAMGGATIRSPQDIDALRPNIDFRSLTPVLSNRSTRVEALTVEIGNTHQRITPSVLAPRNNHEWTFFVRPSRVDIIEKVIIHLHPTFRPSSIICTNEPYEVSRIGWGYFTIGGQLVLKHGYSWVARKEDQPQQDYWETSLTLEWKLNFEGDGKNSMVALQFEREDA